MSDAAFDVEPRQRIGRFLLESGLGGETPRIVPLTGDASDRKYYRVIDPDGDSIVLALHSGPIAFASLPFANVADLLRRVPLPVPAVLGHSDPLGIIALDDLGDVTLQAHLGAAPAGEHAALYRQAVAFIERLQRRGRELASDGYLPYRISFDVEKLTWELDFFVRHFLEAYRGALIDPADRARLAGEWCALATELAAEAAVVCHRDYHSRNLMLHQGGLYVIDFQDARLGPDTYDLVSLLRDSYMDITEQDVDDLLAYFLALRHQEAAGGDAAVEAARFRRRFDVMAVQRNLKALGTFGYQTTSRGNTVYIQYIPRTLRYIRENLLKYPRFSALHTVLARYVDELR